MQVKYSTSVSLQPSLLLVMPTNQSSQTWTVQSCCSSSSQSKSLSSVYRNSCVRCIGTQNTDLWQQSRSQFIRTGLQARNCLSKWINRIVRLHIESRRFTAQSEPGPDTACCCTFLVGVPACCSSGQKWPRAASGGWMTLLRDTNEMFFCFFFKKQKVPATCCVIQPLNIISKPRIHQVSGRITWPPVWHHKNP